MARTDERRLKEAADHAIETIANLVAAEVPVLRRALMAEIARRCMAALLADRDARFAPDVARDLGCAVDRLAILAQDLAHPRAPPT